ncbi:MAG TPA: DUF2905 domain-containing protein [Coprothermobacter sp.]|nr:DUF2905 domain-containing protein [Coprothermobacter sp.]
MSQLGKTLVLFGLCLTVLGVLLWALSSFNIKGIPFGRLPGDIYIKNDNFIFYAPIVSFLLLSAIISIVLHLITRFLH